MDAFEADIATVQRVCSLPGVRQRGLNSVHKLRSFDTMSARVEAGCGYQPEATAGKSHRDYCLSIVTDYAMQDHGGGEFTRQILNMRRLRRSNAHMRNVSTHRSHHIERLEGVPTSARRGCCSTFPNHAGHRTHLLNTFGLLVVAHA